MIVTVTLNPAVDKIYWVEGLKICNATEEEFLTRAYASATSAGGKGVNMSVFLSLMGMESVAMGFVGGYSGHVLVRDLRDKGVTTNFVWTRAETRTNVAVLEKGRTTVPIFIDEAGSSIDSTEMDRFLRRYRRMLARCSWVVLAGSLPPGVDIGAYRELAKLAREAGVKVVLSAGGEALSEGLKGSPHIVKPDTREQRRVQGKDVVTRESIVEAGRQIVAHGGADLVIISHEVTGDVAVAKDAVLEIKSEVPMAELKNLVGADDIFLAGILFKLVQDEPLEQALRFGLAAGLASAETEEKICRDLARIESEMERVSVKQI
jgi:1-phosphofructokinase family hexose kinase